MIFGAEELHGMNTWCGYTQGFPTNIRGSEEGYQVAVNIKRVENNRLSFTTLIPAHRYKIGHGWPGWITGVKKAHDNGKVVVICQRPCRGGPTNPLRAAGGMANAKINHSNVGAP